jgi:hypothetical protein
MTVESLRQMLWGVEVSQVAAHAIVIALILPLAQVGWGGQRAGPRRTPTRPSLPPLPISALHPLGHAS